LKVEIVDLPITDGDFHISVQLPEGMGVIGGSASNMGH